MDEPAEFQSKIPDHVAGLGPASPTFHHAFRVLKRLHEEVNDEAPVQVRFQEWRSDLSTTYGQPVGDHGLFVKHTYLSTLARLIALCHIQPGASNLDKEDQLKVISGEYFRERDIYNFAEEDFFTWVLHPKVLDESLELIGWLIKTLGAHDFSIAGPQLLRGLHQELAGPFGKLRTGPESRPGLGEYCTPDGLAERILRQELKLQDKLDRSLLDPACGPGTFLVTAVRLIREAMQRDGHDEFDTLMRIQNGVMGVDTDPAAVAVARTSYLLALGGLISGSHPPVLVPVYLANAMQLPETTGGSEEPVHIVTTTEANAAFELPDSVVSDPAQLDWLFHRLSQYIHAARFRAGLEGQERATEEVINSLYSYLTSPKRAGLHELPPLSPFAAGVLCQTTRTLIQLALEGKGTVWLHILKNSPAPVFLSRRKFDLVVSDQSRLSKDPTAQFLARTADLYLQDGGSIAFLMPRAAATAVHRSDSGQNSTLNVEQVLDLDQGGFAFNAPSCVVMARKETGTDPNQP